MSHMQICTSPQTDNHTSILPFSFIQTGCLSCHPTNSVKALKAVSLFLKTQAALLDSFIPEHLSHNT